MTDPFAIFAIVDKRDKGQRGATITLEGTIAPEINRLRVFDKDSGIGKQIISKYIKSIEQQIPVSTL
jgi:hypothetical protein